MNAQRLKQQTCADMGLHQGSFLSWSLPCWISLSKFIMMVFVFPYYIFFCYVLILSLSSLFSNEAESEWIQMVMKVGRNWEE